MIVTFWPNLRTPNGERREMTWEQVCATLSDTRRYQGDDHPGWSPAAFDGDRRALERVSAVSALTLDIDHGMSVEQALLRAGELSLGGLLHTTRKHTPDAHRFRVVVPLSRPVSAFEYAALWSRVAPRFGPVDEQAKDASRFWFLPGCPDPETFHAETIDGPELNVDHWLTQQEPRNDTPASPRPTTPIAERARRYIAKMPEAISGSAGHKATFRVAVVLVRGFELDDASALSILEQDYNPRCQPPWKRKELVHKVDSARAGGRMPFGELLRRGDDWQPDWDAGYEPAESNDEPDPIDEEREAIQAEANPETTDDEPARKWRVVYVQDACRELLDVIGSGRSVGGCTLGHYELDAAIGMVRPEHVVGLGAGTSWGKSSAAIMATDENQQLGNNVLIIGTEDAEGMYARRMLQRRGRINAIRMRDNRCTPAELGKAASAVAAMRNDPFLLPAIGMKGEQLALAIRDLVPALNIKLVIVDYIQRVRLQKRTQDRRNEVTLAAEMLADAIKLTGAGGVILSQLKRMPKGQRPTMEDLKESGDLENMCEHVIVGWRQDEVDDRGNEYEARYVSLEKNKDGPAGGELELPFDKATASFLTVKRPIDAFDDDPITDGMFDNEQPHWAD